MASSVLAPEAEGLEGGPEVKRICQVKEAQAKRAVALTIT